MSTSVLLVEDDSKLVAVLERSLAYEGFRVVAVGDGTEAVAAAQRHRPDIALVDIGLPGSDGFEACRQLRLQLDLPVVMLTARDEVIDKVRAFELGADDYVTKPFALEELIVRLHAVLRRAGVASQPLAYGDLVVDLEGRQVWRDGTPVDLTPKEFELLGLFVRHPRQVLTRSQLMEQLWGFDDLPFGNAIEAHIGRLRRKLEVDGATRVIETIRGVGYVLRGPAARAE